MREKVKLKSTDPTSNYYYTTTKNKKTKPEKLKFMKYDPTIRRHVLFEEAKIK